MRPRAKRELTKLARHDPTAGKAVTDVIDALASDPRPLGAVPITGHRPYLRVRSGDYRVIYAVDDSARVVQVARIGNRKEVYRNLGNL